MPSINNCFPQLSLLKGAMLLSASVALAACGGAPSKNPGSSSSSVSVDSSSSSSLASSSVVSSSSSSSVASSSVISSVSSSSSSSSSESSIASSSSSSSSSAANLGDVVSGAALFEEKCSLCHSPNDDGTFGRVGRSSHINPNSINHIGGDYPATVEGLAAYIAAEMPPAPLGDPSDCVEDCARDTAAFIWSFRDDSGLSSSSSSSSSSTSTSSSSSSSSSSVPSGEVSDLATYFDQHPCGVGYDAIGNGGWSACYRLEGGMAACNPIGSPGSAQMVTWSNGTPVTNVAHITAVGDLDVVVVTEDGAAYKGHMSRVPETPIIQDGAISATGGKNPMCIIVENGDKKDLRCGSDLSRPALPAEFDVMQVTAAYGFVCALNKSGEVWCWTAGGNSGLDSIIGATPANVGFTEPMVFIAAGQNSVCGIKQAGGLTCKFSYHDQRFLPAKGMAQIEETPADVQPNAKAVQLAYGKGVVINEDGSAIYYPGGAALSGVGKVVSAGGDRAAISVVNEAGEVFVIDGGSASKVDLSLKAQAAACAL